jgi:hypothetical protein
VGIRKTQPEDQQPEPADDETPLSDERLAVKRWRYRAARRAGLTIAESQMFADSHADIGHLRVLAASGKFDHAEIVDMLLL